MNEKALHILEYDKVITKLTDLAHSAPGKEKCRALLPMTGLSEVEHAQCETADGVALILRKGKPNFAGNRDLSFSLNALSLGSTLSAAELLHIAEVAECTERNSRYGAKEHAEEPDHSLSALFDALIPLPSLQRKIRRCIISEEEIADDASSALKNIRRSKMIYQEKIREHLTQMVNTTYRTYLQDAVITMRNNRYCLPVKAEYKNTVKGMIHDQSKAGSTFFIEPAQIVEYNNKLSTLDAEEKEEIEKILAALSAEAAGSVGELESNCRVLSELDFIFARSNLALSMKGAKPEYTTGHFLDIKKARHPFIDPAKVVPIDIRLGEEYTLLIVTGPNTGGKTVSLKTTGLLCAMGQSGLHIPASSLSKMCIFKDIFADIGDEQSIEQSLSTFSAHMTNIVSILNSADSESLCLLDELCAGTDPTEGAALAIAILKSLRQRGTLTMATTHYSELKVYALSAPDTTNASCEFDVETLSPTYRFLIGLPGKSNAFAISAKLGLSKDIIEDAKGEISETKESFEDLLAELEKSRRALEEKEAAIERDREESARLRDEAERTKAQLHEKKAAILNEAKEEAADILREAKDTADAAIRAYHKGGDIRKMEETRAGLRKRIDKLGEDLAPKAAERPKKVTLKAEDIKKGDLLEIVSMKMKGHVTSLPDAKGNIVLACGVMQIKTNIKDVQPAEEDAGLEEALKGGSRKTNYSGKFSKAATISPEINLIGQTTDEAIANLDKYLDEALLSHLTSVRIVHGKGTGALRDAVTKHLKKLSFVRDFHLGEYGEGDAGVTIVEFK